MKLHKLMCPNCNGELNINIHNQRYVFCPYCGQKFVVEDGIKRIEITKNINNTNRIIDEAEIIRANNEKDIAELKFAAVGLKIIAILMIVMLIAVVISSILNAIETSTKNDTYVNPPKSSSNFKKNNYIEAVKDLENAGFENITAIDLDDASFLKKENTVSKVIIDGENSFSKNDEFSKDSEVIVYYH